MALGVRQPVCSRGWGRGGSDGVTVLGVSSSPGLRWGSGPHQALTTTFPPSFLADKCLEEQQ